MNTSAKDLQDLYQQQLISLVAAEKRHIKSIAKISKTILTDKLKTALNTEVTDIHQHLERLQLCKKTLKNKSTLKAEMAYLLTQAVENYPKKGKPSLLLDLRVMRYMQDAFMQKVAAYQQLQLMANVIGDERSAQLLEQSANDNQNSYAYLQQVSANIIYPAIMADKITSI